MFRNDGHIAMSFSPYVRTEDHVIKFVETNPEMRTNNLNFKYLFASSIFVRFLLLFFYGCK